MDYTNTITKQVSFANPKNPEVEIGYNLTVPSLGSFTRKLYTREQYSGESFFNHGKDLSNVFLIGQNTYFTYLMGHQIQSAGGMPSFMSASSFEKGFRSSPTGFITATRSFMPKLLVPSQRIIDNGIYGGLCDRVHNWQLSSQSYSDGVSIGTTYNDQQQSITIQKALGTTDAQLTLNPAYTPQATSSVPDINVNAMVGGGAFQMVISFFDADLPSKNVQEEGTELPPSGEGKGLSGSTDNKTQPTVYLRLGSLQISIDITGSCIATWITGEKNSATINLVSGAGSECLPQAKLDSSEGTRTFVLTVYPLWNGVAIQSGIQSAINIVNTAAYLPVIQKASIFDCAKMQTRTDGLKIPFDPENPEEVFIKTKTPKGVSVIPDLGTNSSSLYFVARGCSCVLAYAPIYFHKKLQYNHVIRANANINDFTYEYKAYPIWTDNGTEYSTENEITFSDTGLEGPAEFTKIFKSNTISLVTKEEKYQRTSGELFGTIVEMSETISPSSPVSPSNYSNGISNWEDYITNVSVTIGLDGTSGSITFDKYGATDGNQTDRINQFVGKINVSLRGAYNTNNNTSSDSSLSLLFAGYTWETNESASTNGSECTINLIGVEKRLDDIQLINPPIFDGYQFGDVVHYLCSTAGVAYDLSSADSTVRLQMSSDPIETVCFNWSTGLEIRQALDQICKDTAHGYISIDGKLVFFQRGLDGKPNYEGKSWNGFNETNIQSLDLNPDFENLRNQIVLIGMRKILEDGQKGFPEDFPTFPLTTLKTNDTSPNIPWPKRLCYTLPGFPSQKELDGIADNISAGSNFYEIMGTTTIPGTNIKPLDIFMDEFIVINVSHNVDLTSKSWTTTLGLQKR